MRFGAVIRSYYRPPGWTASCGPLGFYAGPLPSQTAALGKGQFTSTLDVSERPGFPRDLRESHLLSAAAA